MRRIIGVVSQKGGVGKSTVARTLACTFASRNLSVKIADLDTSQSTSVEWNARRLEKGVLPEISVEQFSSVSKALGQAGIYDLMIFDGAPHATRATLEIAKNSHMVIIPSGTTLDDLLPTLKLIRELNNCGAPLKKTYALLSRVGESMVEIQEARDWLLHAGIQIINGEIQDKTGYKRALDDGYCLTETRYPSINQKASLIMNDIKKHFDNCLNTRDRE